MKKKQQPKNEIIAKYIAIISLLSDILKEPPIVDANINNENANNEDIPINLATILDRKFSLWTKIDDTSNRLKNKKVIDHRPTPKILEL